MKKILMITTILVFSVCSLQGQNIRQAPLKSKFDNFYYKTPNEKKKVFVVERITYGANYFGKDSKHLYQVSVYGSVGGKKYQVHHNVSSTGELEYFRNAFTRAYKEVLLFENTHKVQGKTYRNTSIVIEY
ncbi:hypothetical protein [Seonamhaeicola sp. ML3]|uniref:hypothetical protein n=1 Tax=Seonamhaeicola sp. ML3 TaxID=2937786 RepID=UPI00200E1C10|nr:hypothetical protein [Seonamhaeicola sp. ML3]